MGRDFMKKIYALFGILGPFVYILAVFIGGALRNDYSQITNTISELTVANAPNKLLMDLMFSFYNISLLIFGVGAYLDSSIDDSKKYRVASIFLALIGLLGLSMYFFPQDPRGAAATMAGTIHIILAGIISPLTIISIFLIGLSMRKYREMKVFTAYSFLSGVIVLVSGGTAAVSIANNSIYGGLFERITIFTFMIWVIILSIIILRGCGTKSKENIQNTE
jgi:hypothetical membrane protein